MWVLKTKQNRNVHKFYSIISEFLHSADVANSSLALLDIYFRLNKDSGDMYVLISVDIIKLRKLRKVIILIMLLGQCKHRTFTSGRQKHQRQKCAE